MALDQAAHAASADADLRARAIKRLKQRRDFQRHVVVYLLVNGFIVLIWMLSNPHGYFWPSLLMAGWGVGLVMHGWDTYRGDEPDERSVQREMQRLVGHR